MNTQLTKIILSTITAITIVACGGSGVGVGLAGIGGSGFIASGSISGFGSVFVNGVEYETDSATFDVDGNLDGIESDLAIGMIVQVSGTINDDGVTGTATSISFDEELQGPVSAVSAPDADGIKRSLTILGLTVIIDSSSTTFDVDNDTLPADFGFGTIAENDNVEVSGFFDTNGDLQATRIELKDNIFNTDDSIIEIEGKIFDYVDDSNFKIDGITGITIDASDANFDDIPNGLLENDLLVEVKGTLNSSFDTITATKIEGEDNTADDADRFELEGIITDYVNDSKFKIGEIMVNASKASREPTSLILENDAHVEVEGAIVDGILIATEVESEGGDIKVHANVTFVDLSTNTFTVEPVAGQLIKVTVNSDTQLEDEVNENEQYTLTDLFNNLGFVEVRGFDDGNGGIIAVEVDLKEESDVVLQGYATAATGDATNGGTITILGVTFNFVESTDFEDVNDINMINSQVDALINAISSTPQLLKVQDDQTADGIADEIDIE